MLKDNIIKYLHNPYPVPNIELVQELVRSKWKNIGKSQINQSNYSVCRFLLGKSGEDITSIVNDDLGINIEYPSLELEHFYQKYGLSVYRTKEVESVNGIKKIREALTLLGRSSNTLLCIGELVQTIHILRKDFEYVDVSYSHPDIPFSIFVSICNNTDTVSSLRVAESILHESMHLKLSLIEENILIVNRESNKRYYSPWREEKRAAAGVVHGLYVFKAIYEFYEKIKGDFLSNFFVLDYINGRQKEIKSELQTLEYLTEIPELSRLGRQLVLGLLK